MSETPTTPEVITEPTEPTQANLKLVSEFVRKEVGPIVADLIEHKMTNTPVRRFTAPILENNKRLAPRNQKKWRNY